MGCDTAPPDSTLALDHCDAGIGRVNAPADHPAGTAADASRPAISCKTRRYPLHISSFGHDRLHSDGDGSAPPGIDRSMTIDFRPRERSVEKIGPVATDERDDRGEPRARAHADSRHLPS